MSSFLLQSFTGLSDFEDKGAKGAFKFGSGLDVRRNRDSLKAGQALKDDLALGGIMNSPVVSVVNATDGNSYWFLANGRILKRTSAGAWSLVYTDVEGVITGACEWGNDNAQTGLYWATATKLHRHAIGGNWSSDVDANAGNPAQTYPKTNLTSATYHTMIPVNGVLMGCNVDTMFLVGYDESYTNNALQLLPGNVSKVLLDDGAYAKICANLSGDKEESWLYIWDGIAQNYNDRESLPFKNINAIIKTEVTIIQFGSNGELYFMGDTTKLPITAFPGGGQVKPYGVDNDNGIALFGVYGNGTGKSGVYSYGRKRKNADFVLNLEYPLDCDSIDAVRKVGSDILIAYKSGSQYGVKIVDTENKVARAVYESLDLKLPATLANVPTVGNVVVDMSPLPAGCSVELWRRLDKKEAVAGTDYLGVDTGLNDGWSQCSLDDGSGSYDSEGGIEAVFNVGDGCKILELRAVLNCSANESPEIFKIQPYF